MDKLKEIIGISIGEASMCWSELPKGVFNSERASQLVDEIYQAALAEAVEREKFLLDNLKTVRDDKETEIHVRIWVSHLLTAYSTKEPT